MWIEIKAKMGAIHNYLGMKLDYTTPRVVKVDVTDNVKLEKFLHKVGGKSATPSTENLFKVDNRSNRFGHERKETFHTCVLSSMFYEREAGLKYNLQMRF